MINLIKLSYTLDFICLLGFFFFPLASSISPLFNYFDELIVLFFLVIVILKSLKTKTSNKYFDITLFILLIYSLFLVFYQKLPFDNVFQIIITLKFLIIFLYFNYKNKVYKIFALSFLYNSITFLYSVSLIISIANFLFPSLFPPSPDERGLNGITLGGVFFSRTIYSSFLVLCIILTLTLKKGFSRITHLVFKNKNKIIFLTLVLILLTFTRKDFLLGLFMVIILFNKILKKQYRIFINVIFIFLISVIPIISSLLFSKINSETFTEDQVRLIILDYGIKIFNDNKPIGTGPGTFGSIMSLNHTDIYKKYEVPTRIYEGLGEQKRGPIFDVFIISILVEYGIGMIFFFLIFIIILKMQNFEMFEDFIRVKILRSSSILYIVLLLLTVPILNNLIGFLIFYIIGLTTQNKIR